MRMHWRWYLVLAGVWKRPWCWLTNHVWIKHRELRETSSHRLVVAGRLIRVCKRCTLIR